MFLFYKKISYRGDDNNNIRFGSYKRGQYPAVQYSFTKFPHRCLKGSENSYRGVVLRFNWQRITSDFSTGGTLFFCRKLRLVRWESKIADLINVLETFPNSREVYLEFNSFSTLSFCMPFTQQLFSGSLYALLLENYFYFSFFFGSYLRFRVPVILETFFRACQCSNFREVFFFSYYLTVNQRDIQSQFEEIGMV